MSRRIGRSYSLPDLTRRGPTVARPPLAPRDRDQFELTLAVTGAGLPAAGAGGVQRVGLAVPGRRQTGSASHPSEGNLAPFDSAAVNLKAMVPARLWAEVEKEWHREVHASHRAAVLRVLPNVLLRRNSVAHWSKTLRTLNRLAAKKCLDYVPATYPIRASGCDEWTWTQIVLRLRTVPIERHVQTCRLTASCMDRCNNIDYDNVWSDLLAYLGNLTADEADRVVALTLSLQSIYAAAAGNTWAAGEVAELVYACAGIPVEATGSWLTHIQKCHDASYSIHAWTHVVKAQAQLEPSQWATYIRHAGVLKQVAPRLCIAVFLYAYTRLPSNCRDGFVSALADLLTSDIAPPLETKDTTILVHALVAIAPAQRQPTVQAICRLQFRQKSMSAIASGLAQLAGLVPGQQEFIIAATNYFLQRQTSDLDALQLACSLADMAPVQDLEQAAGTPTAGIERFLQTVAIRLVTTSLLERTSHVWRCLKLLWPMRDAIGQALRVHAADILHTIDSGMFDRKDPRAQRIGFLHLLQVMCQTAALQPNAPHYAISWQEWKQACRKDVILGPHVDYGLFDAASIALVNLVYSHSAGQAKLMQVAIRCVDGAGLTGDAGQRDVLKDMVRLFSFSRETDRLAFGQYALFRWGSLGRHADGFALQEDSSRLVLARASMARNAQQTALGFKHFGIHCPKSRLALAETCAFFDADIFAHIDEFGLTPVQGARLLADALIHRPEGIFSLRGQANILGDTLKSLRNFDALTWTSQTGVHLVEHLMAQMTDIHAADWRWALEDLTTVTRAFHNRQAALELCIHMLYVRYRGSAEVAQFLCRSNLLPSLYRIRARHLRGPLVAALVNFASHSQSRAAFAGRTLLRVDRHEEGQVLHALLIGCRQQGADVEPFFTALERGSRSTFKDRIKLQAVLRAIASVYTDKSLQTAHKVSVFARIAAGASPGDVYENIGHLQLIYDFDRSDILRNDSIALSTLADGLINENLCLAGVANAGLKYLQTFSKSRVGSAVWRYAASLTTLGEPDVDACMAHYIAGVLQGTFEDNRQDIAANPHLERLHATHPEVLSKWHRASARPLDSGDGAAHWDARAWLYTALVENRHLGRGLQNMPLLETFLLDGAPAAQLQPLLDKAVAEVRGGKRTPLTALQLACVRLIYAKPIAQRAALIKVQQALQDLMVAQQENIQAGGTASLAFRQDVEKQLRQLAQGPKPTSAANLVVLDTSDPYLLLMSGTDVPGSCQRLDGPPHYNKGLLGYLGNGQVRLIAVVDPETQQILTRAVFELLLSDDGPVTYLEKLYGNTAFASAIERTARTKALSMGIPMTRASGHSPLGRPLRSLGGPAPYIYSDAIEDLAQESIFSIPDARVAWPPKHLMHKPARRYSLSGEASNPRAGPQIATKTRQ